MSPELECTAEPRTPTRHRDILLIAFRDYPQITVTIWEESRAKTYHAPSAASIQRLARLLWQWHDDGRVDVTPTTGVPGLVATVS